MSFPTALTLCLSAHKDTRWSVCHGQCRPNAGLGISCDSTLEGGYALPRITVQLMAQPKQKHHKPFSSGTIKTLQIIQLGKNAQP